MSFYSICFSATGRTKAVADFLCQTWGETFTFLDLSDPSWTAPRPLYRRGHLPCHRPRL